MRSGRLAALAGAAFVAASCGAPAGVAGVSTLPPSPPPGGGITAAMDDSEPGHIVPPPGDEPVRVPPPKMSSYTYAFPIKGCKVSYSRKLLVLPKTTIWAAKGCAFVSPVDGVVQEVNVKNLWSPSTNRGADREGRFVTVKGEDGVLYLGGHLDSVEQDITPGTKVKAGQLLGRVGNTGNARDTASNLYFAISWPVEPQYWWVRRGVVPPWTYLDAWDDGNRTVSPRKAMLTLRKKMGATPPCTQLCASNSSQQPTPTPDETKPPTKKKKKNGGGGDDDVVIIPL
ncbi:M23 family metallopeptidase [Microbispora bryophytorum]|uniref:M23 family metallopeptidase n=1 Tax=Microbispora bryophytorum subsp. camponoti TaxID=1677852 RepID=A0ABR8L0C5_9ACTN|nr:M23 family metallopeptidase [Microbispora camponoti]MBD3144456.1 M23 family metallopeptidase [Microbispora camponoti]